MTVAEIEKLGKDFLTVKDVAECLKMAPQIIRDQAERDITLLGFPICRAGHAFRIPRVGFLTWVKGETPTIGVTLEEVLDRIGIPLAQKE